MVTSSAAGSLHEVIRLAHKLTDQAVKQGTLPAKKSAKNVSEGKRKWDEVSNSVVTGNNNNLGGGGNSFNRATGSQNQNRRFDNNRGKSNNGGSQNPMGRQSNTRWLSRKAT
jgi:hypothetical protein